MATKDLPPDATGQATATSKAAEEPLARQALRPQLATAEDAVIDSVDWLVEPCWEGDRLLARLEAGRVTLTDQHGALAPPSLDVAARALEQAIDADQALIDGIWTAMPFAWEGSAARPQPRQGTGEIHRAQWANQAGAVPPPGDQRHAFVAWDLVELDGEPLHDVPYQERRRLLDSVIVEDLRVRVSPAVRIPIDSWVGAWRASGFRRMIAKHVNSRYHHGERNPQWLQIRIDSEKPGVFAILLGRRPRKVPRIQD